MKSKVNAKTNNKIPSEEYDRASTAQTNLQRARRRRTLEDQRSSQPTERPKGYSDCVDKAIEEGELPLKMMLWMRDYDALKTTGKSAYMNEDQRNRLAKVLASGSEEDRATLKQIEHIYEAVREYNNFMTVLKSDWDKASNKLCNLLTRWRTADELAELINEDEGKGVKNRIRLCEEIINREEEYPIYFIKNKATKRYEADVKSGKFYDKIIDTAEYYRDKLTVYKSIIEVLANFAYNAYQLPNGLTVNPELYFPMKLRAMMVNPDKCDFGDYEKNSIYFESELRIMAERGLPIIPEIQERAVIPDYDKIPIDDEVTASSQSFLDYFLNRNDEEV